MRHNEKLRSNALAARVAYTITDDSIKIAITATTTSGSEINAPCRAARKRSAHTTFANSETCRLPVRRSTSSVRTRSIRLVCAKFTIF